MQINNSCGKVKAEIVLPLLWGCDALPCSHTETVKGTALYRLIECDIDNNGKEEDFGPLNVSTV
jgi:hypothetical protein